MASVRDLQAKAKKLLVTWKRQLEGQLKKDNRSTVTHLCMTILMRNSSYKTAHSAVLALRERFADWNEIRVTPIAEVAEILEEAKVPAARAKAFSLRGRNCYRLRVAPPHDADGNAQSGRASQSREVT